MKYFRKQLLLRRTVQGTCTQTMWKFLATVFIVLSVTSQASSRAVYANQLPVSLPHRTGLARRTSDPISVKDDKREYEVTMYLQNQDGKNIYITASGDVAGTQRCDKYGVFSYHVRADKSGYILNKASKKYLAIDNSGKLYTSSDGQSDDADLAMEPASNHPPRHYRIYRIQDNTGDKLYLSLSKPNQQISKKNADIVHLKLSCF